MTDDERRERLARDLAERHPAGSLTLEQARERVANAGRLRELAADTDDPEERERLLGAATEVEGASLNGAGFSRPQA